MRLCFQQGGICEKKIISYDLRDKRYINNNSTNGVVAVFLSIAYLE